MTDKRSQQAFYGVFAFLATTIAPFSSSLLAQPPASQANQSAPATAAEDDNYGNQLFSRLDRNRDGLLTQREIRAEHTILWERLLRRGDNNADGKLAMSEFQKALVPDQLLVLPPAANPEMGTANLNRMFKSLDKNRDGFVELGEIPQQRRRQFLDRLPPNVAPRVNLEQFVQVMRANESVAQRRARFLEVIDRNRDGKVQRQEVPEGLLRGFKKSDANADGVLVGAEVEEFSRRARN